MKSIGRSAQLVLVYCLADDCLKSQADGGNWRKSNNQPKCTDAEIIALAMMQSYFGTATLKRTYLLIKANDPKAFPNLPSYKQWLARLHRLGHQIGVIKGQYSVAHHRFRRDIFDRFLSGQDV